MRPLLSHSGTSDIVIDEACRTVRKTSPDAVGQALFIGVLGPRVSPRVYSIGYDHYVMELLDPLPRENMWGAYLGVIELLWDRVWQHSSPASCYWKMALLAWLERSVIGPQQQLLDALYGQEEPAWCRIHGDPTLANCLRRRDHLVLIDPIPPIARVVPSFREVDAGKMLQSALGWEHLLAPDWPQPPADAVDRVVERLSPHMRARAFYWCAVHLARIVERSQYVRVQDWATAKSWEMLRRAWQEIR